MSAIIVSSSSLLANAIAELLPTTASLVTTLDAIDADLKQHPPLIIVQNDSLSSTDITNLLSTYPTPSILVTQSEQSPHNSAPPPHTTLARPFTRQQLLHAFAHCQSQQTIKLAEIGTLHLDSLSLISKSNQHTNLTEREAELLALLATSHTPQPRDTILSTIWHHTKDLETHTLETHLSRLRAKLSSLFGDSILITHSDEGYQLTYS